jgi:hypothetical protein
MIWILIGFVLGIFVGYWFSKNISYYAAPRLTNFNQTPLNENEEQINIPNVEIDRINWRNTTIIN